MFPPLLVPTNRAIIYHRKSHQGLGENLTRRLGIRRVSSHHRAERWDPVGGSTGEQTERHSNVFNTRVNNGLFVKGGLTLKTSKVFCSAGLCPSAAREGRAWARAGTGRRALSSCAGRAVSLGWTGPGEHWAEQICRVF